MEKDSREELDRTEEALGGKREGWRAKNARKYKSSQLKIKLHMIEFLENSLKCYKEGNSQKGRERRKERERQ